MWELVSPLSCVSRRVHGLWTLGVTHSRPNTAKLPTSGRPYSYGPCTSIYRARAGTFLTHLSSQGISNEITAPKTIDRHYIDVYLAHSGSMHVLSYGQSSIPTCPDLGEFYRAGKRTVWYASLMHNAHCSEHYQG